MRSNSKTSASKLLKYKDSGLKTISPRYDEPPKIASKSSPIKTRKSSERHQYINTEDSEIAMVNRQTANDSHLGGIPEKAENSSSSLSLQR